VTGYNLDYRMPYAIEHFFPNTLSRKVLGCESAGKDGESGALRGFWVFFLHDCLRHKTYLLRLGFVRKRERWEGGKAARKEMLFCRLLTQLLRLSTYLGDR